MSELMRPWATHENRCDYCGSESWFIFQRILRINEDDMHVQDLFFCGHHGNKNKAVLVAQGWDSDDYTAQINPVPSLSAAV